MNKANDNLAIMAIGMIIGLIVGGYVFTDPVEPCDCTEEYSIPKAAPQSDKGSGLILACTEQFEKCIYQ